MEMKFKKKKEQTKISCIHLCRCRTPRALGGKKNKKTLRVLARLLELKGKFWFVASE